MFFCLFCSADLCWFWNSSFVQPQCHRLHNSASSSSCSCSGSVPCWDWCPHLPHHFSHLCHWRSRGRGPDRRRGELDPRGSEWWGCTKDLVSLLVFFFWCWGRNKDIMVKNDKLRAGAVRQNITTQIHLSRDVWLSEMHFFILQKKK